MCRDDTAVPRSIPAISAPRRLTKSWLVHGSHSDGCGTSHRRHREGHTYRHAQASSGGRLYRRPLPEEYWGAPSSQPRYLGCSQGCAAELAGAHSWSLAMTSGVIRTLSAKRSAPCTRRSPQWHRSSKDSTKSFFLERISRMISTPRV